MTYFFPLSKCNNELQLFYYLLTLTMISLSSRGHIEKLNGPHMAPGPSLSMSYLDPTPSL